MYDSSSAVRFADSDPKETVFLSTLVALSIELASWEID